MADMFALVQRLSNSIVEAAVKLIGMGQVVTRRRTAQLCEMPLSLLRTRQTVFYGAGQYSLHSPCFLLHSM